MKKRIKGIIFIVAVLMLSATAAACGGGKPVVTAVYDTVYLLTGTEVRLTDYAAAKDGKGNSIGVTVKDEGGFDADAAGRYQVVFEAAASGKTASKTVEFKVVDPAIDIPEVTRAGVGITVNAPELNSGAASETCDIYYRTGGQSYSALVLTDGTATLNLGEAGSYDFKYTFTLDGQILETVRNVEVYAVSYRPAVSYAVTGQAYSFTLPAFSDNVDTSKLTVGCRKSGAGEFLDVAKTGGVYTVTLNDVGYYEVSFNAECNGKPFSFIKEFYARTAQTTIDLEGADGEHFGFGDQQYWDNGGVSMLKVSDEWSKDGRYSLRHNSNNLWSGMTFTKALEIGASNVLVCYIFSEDTYNDTQISVFTDATDYAITDKFTVKKGENKYYLSFNKSFDKIKTLCMFSKNSVFYLDALEFKTADISNIMSLGDVSISAAHLNSGDKLTLPVPEVTSTYYTAAQLAAGIMTVTAKAGNAAAVEVPLVDGKYSLTVQAATYVFTYSFTCDDYTVTKAVTANVARFDLRADCPTALITGEPAYLENISGADDDAAVSVYLIDAGGGSIELSAEIDGRYRLLVTEEGYYSVRIYAENDRKNGEVVYRFYAREYDISLDFEGVGETLGYVRSYTAAGMNGYTSVSTDWAADGERSLYIDMIATNVWYGTAGLAIGVQEGANSVTLTVNATAALVKKSVLWIQTEVAGGTVTGIYSEAFLVQKGVHTYTLRLGASSTGIFTAFPTAAIKKIVTFCFASTDTSNSFAEDRNKALYIDRVVFHKYSAFEAVFEQPELKLNTAYSLSRPMITSANLSDEEIAEIDFTVQYQVGGDDRLYDLQASEGVYNIRFTASGTYKLILTAANRYHKETVTYSYALGTVDFDAVFPGAMETATEYELSVSNIRSDSDITGAVTAVSYKKSGDSAFTDTVKRLGKFYFSVKEPSTYTLRFTVTCGNMSQSKTYDVYVRQAGVFMDFEPEGANGYGANPYENPVFLPELSDEWSYDGDHSLKVTFVSEAWFGFTYLDENFTVPVGSDQVSLWIKSSRTFTYTSFLAFSAYDTTKNAYVWYYSGEFVIEAGVNLYQVKMYYYTERSKEAVFTAAMAGRIRDFTIHTEYGAEGEADHGSEIYFDSVRFINTEYASFTEMTLPAASAGREYVFNYSSPSGFYDEGLSLCYRAEGSEEWITVYETDGYDGEEIKYTFDAAGRVSIRFIVTSGALQTSYHTVLVIN